jgi:hypothetical protein
MPKNYFGGRVLLPFEMFINLGTIFNGPEYFERWYPKGTPTEQVKKESEE